MSLALLSCARRRQAFISVEAPAATVACRNLARQTLAAVLHGFLNGTTSRDDGERALDDGEGEDPSLAADA